MKQGPGTLGCPYLEDVVGQAGSWVSCGRPLLEADWVGLLVVRRVGATVVGVLAVGKVLMEWRVGCNGTTLCQNRDHTETTRWQTATTCDTCDQGWGSYF